MHSPCHPPCPPTPPGQPLRRTARAPPPRTAPAPHADRPRLPPPADHTQLVRPSRPWQPHPGKVHAAVRNLPLPAPPLGAVLCSESATRELFWGSPESAGPPPWATLGMRSGQIGDNWEPTLGAGATSPGLGLIHTSPRTTGMCSPLLAAGSDMHGRGQSGREKSHFASRTAGLPAQGSGAGPGREGRRGVPRRRATPPPSTRYLPRTTAPTQRRTWPPWPPGRTAPGGRFEATAEEANRQ